MIEKNRIKQWLLLAPLASILVACGGAEHDVEATAPAVGVVQLKAEDAVLRSELAGRTAAFRTSEVRPQVSGIVLRRLFEEGTPVKAGQMLYEIDAASYAAACAQAEANLANARASLSSLRNKAERYAELIAIEGVSHQELEDAQAAYAQGEAALKAAAATLTVARVDLERTRITAPINGRIGRSTVTEGALVTAGQSTALATIQQLDPIHVDIVQSSQDMVSLKRRLAAGGLLPGGTRVALTLEDGSAYEHAGVMKFSEVNVDVATGAVTLRAEFPNPNGLLLPGMYVRAEVEQGIERGAILVPQQGVAHNAKSEPTALIVTADNKVEERVLTTLGTQGNRWIVSSGLNAGERLIVDGLQRAIPGQAVHPIPVAPTVADHAPNHADHAINITATSTAIGAADNTAMR